MSDLWSWFVHSYADPSEPTFWVFVAFVLFFALLIWKKVPSLVAGMLDDRAQRIAKELEDARRMREEAQEMLANYQRRQREAEQEAEAIVEAARKEAKRLHEATRKQLAERLERRAEIAEAKIAQAEQQAAAEVRAAAADLSIEAARALLTDKLDAKTRKALLESSLEDLESRLN